MILRDRPIAPLKPLLRTLKWLVDKKYTKQLWETGDFHCFFDVKRNPDRNLANILASTLLKKPHLFQEFYPVLEALKQFMSSDLSLQIERQIGILANTQEKDPKKSD